jgi:Family of unknown function (DUF6159)
MATPVVIGGKRIGKLRASFLLFKESWRFLVADKELLLIPLITSILNLCLLGFVIGVAVLLTQDAENPVFTGDTLHGLDYVLLGIVYAVAAFTLALSQAAITHTVYTRMHNGNATLGGSLKVAFSHAGTLFVWSLITATVGVLLRIIADRFEFMGRIVSVLMGAAWAIATFFVIPAIVIGKKGAVESIPFSITTFKRTWGETLISNITLGLFFFVAYLVALVIFIGLIVLGTQLDNLVIIIFAIILAFAWIIVASLAQAALQGIIKTVLYVYATDTSAPLNFNRELLEAMLVRNPRSTPEQQTSPASAIQ